MKRLILVFILFFLSIFSLNAGTIIVTNTNDSGNGSLRNAILSSLSGDTVRFLPTIISSGTDTLLLTSSISININLTIIGLYNSNDTLFISGNDSAKIFDIDSVTRVTLDSLAIIDGFSASNGGAISFKSSDSLIVKNSFFRNNKSLESGGVIYGSTLVQHSYLLFENCFVYKNQADTNGGAIYLFSEGTSGTYSRTTNVDIINSLFLSNLSKKNGGAICLISNNVCSLNITKSKLIDNNSFGNGGAVFISYTIEGTSFSNERIFLTCDSSILAENKSLKNGGGMYVFGSGISWILFNYSELRNNIAQIDGGGYYITTTDRSSGSETRFHSKFSKIADNEAINGGAGCSYVGRFSSSANKVFIHSSSVYGNRASNCGGGFYSYLTNSLPGFTTMSLDIYHSSFFDNSATNDGGSFYSLQRDIASIDIVASTFTNNRANNGGALYTKSSHNWIWYNINNVTIYKNTATVNGGGIYTSSGVSSTYTGVESSIIALNNGSNNIFNSSTQTITSLGKNIFSDVSLSGSITSDFLGVDSITLNLDTLANNGGFTRTLLPLIPSVAIDMGVNPPPQGLSTVIKAQNGSIVNISDIGAAESGLRFINDTICRGSYISPFGTLYLSSGTFMDTVKNSLGLDSLIYNIYLVDLRIFSTISKLINTNDSILFGGKYLKTVGTYFDTIQNSFGCDSIIKLNINNITGVNGENNKYSFKMYPNPANNIVTIDFGRDNIDAKISIFDVTGKNISSMYISNKSSCQLSTSSLSSGTYFVTILIDGDHKTLRLVKN